MSRLQKKCFIAAGGFHLLLVVILLVGPAFLAARAKKPEENDIKILDVIPGKLIDAAFSGGGTPNVTPPPPAPPAPPAVPPVVTPVVAPPTPPKPPEQVVKPTPPTPPVAKPVEKEKPEIDPLAHSKPVKPAPTKPKDSGINLTKVTRSGKDVPKNTKPVPDNSAAEARAQQVAMANARKTAIGKSLQNLQSGLSTAVDVAIPGPGGEAYANYGDALASVYYHAWVLPDEASDDNASVKVKVTLARDGSIVSARVVARSGNAALDRSVERVLNHVQSFQPFPEGTTDRTRTFNFEFQPKFRKLIG